MDTKRRLREYVENKAAVGRVVVEGEAVSNPTALDAALRQVEVQLALARQKPQADARNGEEES